MGTTGTPGHRRHAAIVAICLAVASAAGVGAAEVASATTPDPCTALSARQLRSWFGKEVAPKPMRGGPGEQGCQWLPKDGSAGGLALTYGPADGYSPPTHRFGYDVLTSIGDKAYIVPVQGGWEAGALKGRTSVWARSPNLSTTVAPAVLKMAVAKL
jgi:hypothetical protein